ncbi:hypothetical protein [Methylomonas lenta]|uniref:hypothetical protein n=1 Tax=Methylomonas lenta TaxID=980561 RepID=UPI00082F2354|nr:hypothetical protein [Methylomonas lenta]
MSKDGIGDLQQWQKYTNISTGALYLLCATWLSTIFYAAITKCFKTKSAQLAIGLPPLFAVSGWASLWFI